MNDGTMWQADGNVKILLLLSPCLLCVSAGQGCNLGQCMCGLTMCIGHDAPQASHIEMVVQCGKKMEIVYQ